MFPQIISSPSRTLKDKGPPPIFSDTSMFTALSTLEQIKNRKPYVDDIIRRNMQKMKTRSLVTKMTVSSRAAPNVLSNYLTTFSPSPKE